MTGYYFLFSFPSSPVSLDVYILTSPKCHSFSLFSSSFTFSRTVKVLKFYLSFIDASRRCKTPKSETMDFTAQGTTGSTLASCFHYFPFFFPLCVHGNDREWSSWMLWHRSITCSGNPWTDLLRATSKHVQHFCWIEPFFLVPWSRNKFHLCSR